VRENKFVKYHPTPLRGKTTVVDKQSSQCNAAHTGAIFAVSRTIALTIE